MYYFFIYVFEKNVIFCLFYKCFLVFTVHLEITTISNPIKFFLFLHNVKHTTTVLIQLSFCLSKKDKTIMIRTYKQN